MLYIYHKSVKNQKKKKIFTENNIYLYFLIRLFEF